MDTREIDLGDYKGKITTHLFSVEAEMRVPIKASAATVWSTLMNTSEYQWNPFIEFTEGSLTEGATIRANVHFQAPGPENNQLTAVLREVDPVKGIHWRGRIATSGKDPHGVRCRDEQHIEVRAINENSCEVLHRERLSGVQIMAKHRNVATWIAGGIARMDGALLYQMDFSQKGSPHADS